MPQKERLTMWQVSLMAAMLVGAAACTTTTDDDNAGGADPMPDPAACEACIEPLTGAEGACQPAIDACAAVSGCLAWLDCTEICFDGDFTAACLDACEQEHVEGSAQRAAVQGCVCAPCSNACGQACAP